MLRYVEDLVYCHRSNIGEIKNFMKTIDKDAIDRLKAAMEWVSSSCDFKTNMIIYNQKNGTIYLGSCPDWKKVHEPVLKDCYIFRKDGTCRYSEKHSGHWVIHEKWKCVENDYNGFNIDYEKKRADWLRHQNAVMYCSGNIDRKNVWEKVLKSLNIEK